jgi:hypothetical protein
MASGGKETARSDRCQLAYAAGWTADAESREYWEPIVEDPDIPGL